jgi:hypothetical protein
MKTKLKDLIEIHDGKKFEDTCVKLLEIKYGATDFQEIPALDQGDLGLDGYNFTPEAFQCYAPEKTYTTSKLYEKQRDKITADINKFINNEKQLKKLIGNKVFEKWIFLTPNFDSKRLNLHAGVKTKEVLDKNLSHVSKDFQIVIKLADSFFENEIDIYKQKTRKYLNIENPVIDQSIIVDWKTSNTGFAETLSRKLSKLGLDDDMLNKCINLNIENYLALDMMMKETFEKNKDVFEDIVKSLDAKTRAIELKSSMGQVKTIADIEVDLGQLEEILKEKLNDFIKPEIREILKTCKISDWLIKCPLDFK